MLAIAGFYKEWFGYGEGLGNFMAYGDLPSGSVNDPASFFFPRGVILGRDLSTVHPVDPGKVAEYVTHSWYEYSTAIRSAVHPARRRDESEILGSEAAVRTLDTDAKYSWLKSPRYDDKPMEVGPLARTLVAYASGDQQVKKTVDAVLAKFNAPPTALFSTLGRIAARAIEARPHGAKAAGVDRAAGRQHGARRYAHPQRRQMGSRHPGRSPAPASGSRRRRAARWATGSRSRTRKSSTTSALFLPPGTPDRAMRTGSEARMRPHC